MRCSKNPLCDLEDSHGGECMFSPDMPDDSPSVIGAHLAPLPTQHEAETAWRALFAARLVERGVDEQSAKACAAAGDVRLEDDPAEAADDEMSYWDADE